jgi:hypothetical protein
VDFVLQPDSPAGQGPAENCGGPRAHDPVSDLAAAVIDPDRSRNCAVEALRFEREAIEQPQSRKNHEQRYSKSHDRGGKRIAADEPPQLDKNGMNQEGQQDCPRGWLDEWRNGLVQLVSHHGKKAEEEQLKDSFAIHRVPCRRDL